MSTERKPLIEQIKETIKNKDQISDQVMQNLQTTRRIVELQAKDLLQKTKKSKFFNEKIIPLAESDLADKAIDALNTKLKLKDTPIMKGVEKLRKEILDSKVAKAKPAKVPKEDKAT
jgi:hypothetical protein